MVFYLLSPYNAAGEFNGPGNLSMLSYDQLVQDDPEQDSIAVVYLLEARFICRQKIYWMS